MITIVGAGPAGSYLAYLLAKQGKDVTLIEEHDKIGSPVQCTGIVTGSIEKFVKLPNSIIANRCNKVIAVSKNERIVAETDEIVMWRNKFDEFIAGMAADAGVKILTSHQFIGFNNKNSLERSSVSTPLTIKIKNKNDDKIKNIESDIIVGADGPSSAVAKATGLNSNSKFYIGMQAKVKLKSDIDAFQYRTLN